MANDMSGAAADETHPRRRTPTANLVHLAQAGILVAMLAGALAGCASSPAPPTFDLTAPTDVPTARRSHAQLVVTPPAAVQVLDSDRIVVRKDGEVSYLAGAQWADHLPSLFQTRLIQTFENDHRLAAVGRPEDRLAADASLVSEIRAFEIDVGSGQAVVSVSAKIVSASSGKIIAGQLFSASQPTAGTDGPQAAAALDAALQTVLRNIVVWADAKI